MNTRVTPITSTSWVMLGIILFASFIAFSNFLGNPGIDLLTTDTDTGTTSTASGLELVTVSGDEELSLLRGCSADQLLKLQNSGVWACDDDSTTSVTGAGADVLDLGDDGSNESSDFNELATTGDTNSIVTEPSADKVLFDMGQNWPTADAADALSSDPDDCSASQFAQSIGTTGSLTCAQVAFSDLSGSATDAQVPNDITIDNAATADAATSNGTNCSDGEGARGVDTSWNAEGCTDFADVSGDTFTGTVTFSGADLNLGIDCSGFTNGGTLSTTGSGVVHCQDDDGGGGSGDISDVGDCSTGACFTEGGTGTTIYFEGSSADGFEFIMSADNPTADRLFNFPDDALNDDDVLMGDGVGSLFYAALTDCDDSGGNHLNYDTTTNSFSCGTSSSVTDTSANTECAGSNTYLDGEGNCDTLDGLEDFETATDDGLAVGNGSTFDTKVVSDCDDSGGQHLNYDTTSNAFSCGTSGDGTGYDTIQDEGSGLTQRATLNMTGSGVTCSDTGSITECDIPGGGSTNSFETLSVPNGTDPVADASNDTLNITEGSGIDITGTAGTDTILWEFNAGELGSLTFGTGSGFTWTFNASAGTDPQITFGDGLTSFLHNVLFDNQAETRWGEADGNGSNYIAVKAPAAVTTNQTCTLEDDATPFDSCVTANPADQNLFETIDAPSGTDPVADSTTDTLSFTSSQGTVGITGNSSTDTLDFDAVDVNCTGCLGTTEVAGLDVSDDTNLAAGRSLTLSGDSVEADSELFTIAKSIAITNPTTGSHTNKVQLYFGTAVTLTRVACSTDSGTVTIQFDERAEGTPNSSGTDVLTSALACDNDSQATTSFSNAGIAVDVPLNLQLTDTTGSPGVVRIHLKATRDD